MYLSPLVRVGVPSTRRENARLREDGRSGGGPPRGDRRQWSWSITNSSWAQDRGTDGHRHVQIAIDGGQSRVQLLVHELRLDHRVDLPRYGLAAVGQDQQDSEFFSGGLDTCAAQQCILRFGLMSSTVPRVLLPVGRLGVLLRPVSG